MKAGIKPTTLRSSVQLANHYGTVKDLGSQWSGFEEILQLCFCKIIPVGFKIAPGSKIRFQSEISSSPTASLKPFFIWQKFPLVRRTPFYHFFFIHFMDWCGWLDPPQRHLRNKFSLPWILIRRCRRRRRRHRHMGSSIFLSMTATNNKWSQKMKFFSLESFAAGHPDRVRFRLRRRSRIKLVFRQFLFGFILDLSVGSNWDPLQCFIFQLLKYSISGFFRMFSQNQEVFTFPHISLTDKDSSWPWFQINYRFKNGINFRQRRQQRWRQQWRQQRHQRRQRQQRQRHQRRQRQQRQRQQ